MPLGFAHPLMLAGLVVLPALWLLLRIVPPRPERLAFPPLRLLLGLVPTDETPARSPLWLTLLRLGLATLAILLLSGPIWNPHAGSGNSSGPLLLILDNGWPSAPKWEARVKAAAEQIAEAGNQNRPVAVVATAEPPGDISLDTAAVAYKRLRALVPQPWTPQREQHLGNLKTFIAGQLALGTVWVSDGLAVSDPAGFLTGLKEALAGRPLTIVDDSEGQYSALAGAKNEVDALKVRVLRVGQASTKPLLTGTVNAFDIKGLPLGAAPFTLAPGEDEAMARLDMPVDLRNDVVRLEITAGSSAGAVQLLDDRWHRRVVGVVTGQTADVAQPLLSATYYLSRALEPYADVRAAEGVGPSEAVSRMIADKLPVIMAADVGVFGDAQAVLESWVEKGGVLVRFAGSHVVRAEDKLVPITLRGAGRTLGSALSWEQPQPLGGFSGEGPFAGLDVPSDVSVTRQILAEPDADLAAKTWASLADGTPLVTAAKRGKGLIVLFHVTADTSWSNLPLSGSFVEMLRRIVALSGPSGTHAADKASGDRAQVLAAPTRILDGWGVLRAPPPHAQPVNVDAPGLGQSEHPPGFYGPADALVAVNALASDVSLRSLRYEGLGATINPLLSVDPIDLTSALLLGALALLMADCLAVLVLSGGLSRLRRLAGAAAVGVAVILAGVPGDGQAQTKPAQAQPFDAALRTHLAYVITGDKETDETSLAGLRGLTAYLASRTALDPGEPVGINPERDELSFHAFLYWPIVAGAPKPPPAAMAKIETFMKSGGTILFDTRDALASGAGFGATPAGETLQKLLTGLDIPDLEPVPHDHVLTKTFYLIERFPGRTEDGETWVEALPADASEDGEERPARAGDEVSPIIVTSNDLAAAWAVGPEGQALFPLTPDSPRQREFAYRAGVNIVMYALTGNYKADQVHMPALLERLGQ